MTNFSLYDQACSSRNSYMDGPASPTERAGSQRPFGRQRKQLAEMHVTPGSRAEQWRNRHIREGSLSGAGVELRELEHFHYRIARLTRGEIRYGEAAAIIRPLRQRFTAEQVDGKGNVGSRFDD